MAVDIERSPWRRGDTPQHLGGQLGWHQAVKGTTNQYWQMQSTGLAAWHTLTVSDLTGGGWTSVTHNGANFTASAGNWTVASGDQTTFKYLLLGGSTMFVQGVFVTTTTSSTPATLSVALPASKSAVSVMSGYGRFNENGTLGVLNVQTAVSGTTVNLSKNDGTNFAAVTDLLTIVFNMVLEVA